ncbi:TetR family transcriptional regulator [Sulfitobacter noctilucicola]|uniref:AcrR family transcriptional regulator n=1 Tax=Sulfitobacter noctilucicola TaxID=1342301 RepID=A0A7W6M4D7_9RHOB|nr:TetR/AcrR family transcriptional regulator [Sulfitobacter noctilucicola]KIN63224.1 TetR family transcriptional regulator [Sulfitobacter noctilucicola]MBB4172249.1 AcrR family transcriptional regulator [Sulfitobacter noctilucicola]
MRNEKREARMREIEAEAYALFAAAGYDGTSMLAVAKRAKASNETLYRWYGDKTGLFESMVRANAEKVQQALRHAAEGEGAPLDVLERVAPVLLEMLLSDRAIALNKAAASDVSGTLGKALAKGGRETVLPLIEELMRSAIESGSLAKPSHGTAGALFMSLLVGDRQIRRVIGALSEPSRDEIETQARVAIAQFRLLCASATPAL